MVRTQSKPSISVPVSLRAVCQRLARALARDGRTLKKTRAAPARKEIGDYFIVNGGGEIIAHHVDLVQLARKIGVLQPYEHLLVKD